MLLPYMASLQFASAAIDIQRRLDSLARACKQVLDSARLRAVLEAILAIGNVMNAGTHKGGAQGFTLDRCGPCSVSQHVWNVSWLLHHRFMWTNVSR